jgi:release factor glutamine methyltransferase
MTSIKNALFEAQALLSHSESARLDAEILLAHILKKTRTFLYAHASDELNVETLATYQTILAKRVTGIPVAYLTGTREFWSLPLRVNESTLIPRPETELLVECTLDLLSHQTQASILDLGTGSGAIALALACSKPHWNIKAVDLNPSALSIAQHNALQLNIHNISWIQSDWFSSIPLQSFDAIVSNPPYIEENDPHLDEGDVRFEPRLALTSGSLGLDALTRIILHSTSYLKPKGLLLLEHGYNQAEAVANLLKQAHFQSVECFLDAQGHPRVSIGYCQ